MKNFLASRHAKLALLAVAALVNQGDSPVVNCVNGTQFRYTTNSMSPAGMGSSGGVRVQGAPLGGCFGRQEDGSFAYYDGNGSTGRKVAVVDRTAVYANFDKASKAMKEDSREADVDTAGRQPPRSRSQHESPVGQSAEDCADTTSTLSNVKLRDLKGEIAKEEIKAEKRRQKQVRSDHRKKKDDGRQPADSKAGKADPATDEPAAEAEVEPEPKASEQVTGERTDVSPLPPVSSHIVSTLEQSAAISEEAGRVEIVEAALARQREIASAAKDDEEVLKDKFRSATLDQLAEKLQRAQQSLENTASLLESDVRGDLDSSEKARFRNHFLNARDKAALGLDAIRDDRREKEKEGQLGANSPFLGLLGSKATDGKNALAKIPALASIFGPEDAPEETEDGKKAPPAGGKGPGGARRAVASLPASTTNDALTNRLVMLNGLTEDEQRQALARLKLLEQSKLKLKSGTQVSVNLLHNGYILGGGATGVDCSSFVSSVLPADLRKGRFTTLDFRMMWLYAKTQVFLDPPTYSKDRKKLVMDTSSAFIPIDLYAGDKLAIGDILVYRYINDPIGHVVIVRSFNPTTLRAEVIEAGQSTGRIDSRTLELSPDPITAPKRLLMPGLSALRLKPVSNKACTYKDGARLPASGKSGGGAR